MKPSHKPVNSAAFTPTEAILESISDGVFTVDKDWRITSFNRAAEEITDGFGRRTAPAGVRVYNPAFDVTPARLIAAIVTERGIIRRPNAEKIRKHLSGVSS